MKRKVAVVGTAGLPAAYGGFETLAENLVRHLGARYEFTVYCKQTKCEQRRAEYAGARLVYFPLASSGWQSFPYDTLSLLHGFATADIVLYLGPVAGPILKANLLARKNLVVNFGGLNEWERPKLSASEQRYLHYSFSLSARLATTAIADNTLLRNSIEQEFGVRASIVRYGGDHVTVSKDPTLETTYPFSRERFFISVSRAQVDNNLHIVIDAFKAMPEHTLVLISNWDVSAYGRELFANNQGYANIILLPAIYDQSVLSYLRSKAVAYIHSHSYCGTAPSLVEAMCLKLPVLSWDVPTNRETTQGKALFFNSVEGLRALVDTVTPELLWQLGEKMGALAAQEYSWSHVAGQYAEIFERASSQRAWVSCTSTKSLWSRSPPISKLKKHSQNSSARCFDWIPIAGRCAL